MKAMRSAGDETKSCRATVRPLIVSRNANRGVFDPRGSIRDCRRAMSRPRRSNTPMTPQAAEDDRSEERRVGKECRSRRAPEHKKKKKDGKRGTIHQIDPPVNEDPRSNTERD